MRVGKAWENKLLKKGKGEEYKRDEDFGCARGKTIVHSRKKGLKTSVEE